jgi:DNA-directed RNA polymerase subunit K/omega
MGAPPLLEVQKIDPIEIAILEFEEGVTPITIKSERETRIRPPV